MFSIRRQRRRDLAYSRRCDLALIRRCSLRRLSREITKEAKKKASIFSFPVTNSANEDFASPSHLLRVAAVVAFAVVAAAAAPVAPLLPRLDIGLKQISDQFRINL